MAMFRSDLSCSCSLVLSSTTRGWLGELVMTLAVRYWEEVVSFLKRVVASLHQPWPAGSTRARQASDAWNGRTEKQDSSLRVLLRVTTSTCPRSTKKTSTSPSELSLAMALCHNLSLSDLVTCMLSIMLLNMVVCFMCPRSTKKTSTSPSELSL